MDAQPADSGKSQGKALKFVTNYGQPQVKRRRIGAACLTCRKRKTACSGERPTCETCSQNRLECAGYSSETATAPGHKRTTSENGHREVKPKQLKREDDGIDPSLKAPTNAHRAAAPPLHSQWSSETMQQPPRPPAPDAASNTNGTLRESLFSGPRNRMPYFRWLGPTAIMPGFKQMVVKVKRQDTDVGHSSANEDTLSGLAGSPAMNDGSAAPTAPNQQRLPSVFSGTPIAIESDTRTPLNLPFYDTSPMPPSELITHLVQTFFTHLGCNYPFLQRERFLRDLEEKQVDAILVDAVCALAARFSTHSLLMQQNGDENKPSPAEYGHAFAQRAKTALVDTYSCPSVAAVQAALLLAYLEFGESRDSGLWMYLGISIRMAQDLGLHKLEGLRYRGKTGPTPKMIKRESVTGLEHPSRLAGDKIIRSWEKEVVIERVGAIAKDEESENGSAKEIEEQQSVEQERVDTLWAVFFLDRVVSSGTGRRCMLRDKDIEISFPLLDEKDPKTGWPAPFPALIRIVHLYGRVADLLNSIKEPSDITTDTPKRLASMENQVTTLYQGLSSRLHFDAVNFQHYMKAGEGTNFVLLHFWFHLLIVLLHQPTLLKTFEGKMLQLFPNSQQLSMSSAKTIADILSYSQLMDAKASLGNPFTSQPIYIAACAFLKETAEQTATSNQHSGASSPASGSKNKDESRPPSSTTGTPLAVKRMSISELSNSHPSSDSASDKPTAPPVSRSKVPSSEQPSTSTPKQGNTLAKHTLLATAATQHYQLCYKALQSLETYWAGAKYILTVLDQKFEGVGDPLLYTVEEGESSMEQPRPKPAFTSPGWRRKASWGQYLPGNAGGLQSDLWHGKGWGQVMSEGGSGDPSKGKLLLTLVFEDCGRALTRYSYRLDAHGDNELSINQPGVALSQRSRRCPRTAAAAAAAKAATATF